jgi:tricorn protease
VDASVPAHPGDEPAVACASFEKELREYRNKEAMIIDQRWNGGGNIEQELLGDPRSNVSIRSGSRAGTKQRVVRLRDSSDQRSCCKTGVRRRTLRCFRRAFRALGLGKVIGTPDDGTR